MTQVQYVSTLFALTAIFLMTNSSLKQNKYQRRIGNFLFKDAKQDQLSFLHNKLMNHLPNRELIQAKLDLTQSNLSVRKIRITQISYAIIGFVTGLAFNLTSLTESILLPKFIWLGFVWFGWYFPMASLNSRFQKLKDELNFGFAEVVDLIALSVTAGNSLSTSLIVVSELVKHPWQNQLRLLRQDLISGLSVATSLERAALRMQHPTFTKFVNSILITLDRGTPLAAHLRIQATEVTEQIRRDLLVRAGKKETTMLLPVVFLILPSIVVVVTLFPGVMALGNLI